MTLLVINLLPMNEVEWRNAVQIAAQRAYDEGVFNMSALAERVEWSQPQMTFFREKGTGDYQKVQLLARLLTRYGMLDDLPEPRPNGITPDPPDFKDLVDTLLLIRRVLLHQETDPRNRLLLADTYFGEFRRKAKRILLGMRPGIASGAKEPSSASE